MKEMELSLDKQERKSDTDYNVYNDLGLGKNILIMSTIRTSFDKTANRELFKRGRLTGGKRRKIAKRVRAKKK